MTFRSRHVKSDISGREATVFCLSVSPPNCYRKIIELLVFTLLLLPKTHAFQDVGRNIKHRSC